MAGEGGRLLLVRVVVLENNEGFEQRGRERRPGRAVSGHAFPHPFLIAPRYPNAQPSTQTSAIVERPLRFDPGVNTPWQAATPARNMHRLPRTKTQLKKETCMMKILHPLALPVETAPVPFPLSAANFSRTALGRAALHLECLCHHPVAARFYFRGLTWNLREWAWSAR